MGGGVEGVKFGLDFAMLWFCRCSSISRVGDVVSDESCLHVESREDSSVYHTYIARGRLPVVTEIRRK